MAMTGAIENVAFTGHGGTIGGRSKRENKQITLVPEARITPV
jgi:hypothetical protein